MATTIDQIRLIKFWQHDNAGILTVFQTGESEVPFPIRRVFAITGVPAGGRRANHAHRNCRQLHICICGRVAMHLTDGTRSREIELTDDGIGAMVPPLIWSSIIFDHPETALMVICDEPYDESDYIRDWQEYLSLQNYDAG